MKTALDPEFSRRVLFQTDFRANFLLCEAKGRPNEYYIAELSLEVMVANMVLEIGQYSKLFYKEVPQGPLWGFSYAYSTYFYLGL